MEPVADPRTKLSEPVMCALDAARACAAGYVVVHHFTRAHELSQGFGVVFRFGQEAVLVFFLLSGFVIFANEHQRAVHPKGYYLRRLRRIYPPLLCAMILSTLVAMANDDLTLRFHWTELWGTILGLQDLSFLKPGVIVDPYLGNEPLWSLSYELFFYLMFPPILRLWKAAPRRANHVIGTICCGCYILFTVSPNHFTLMGSYFLVWWCGAMAANAYLSGGRSCATMPDSYGWLVALCAVAAMAVFKTGYRGAGYYPFLPLRHFAMAALMLAALFGPLGKLSAAMIGGGRKLFSGIASISYGLYVLHFPLLVQWKTAWSATGLVGSVVLLLLLAYLVERRLPRILPSAPKA
jgi:peptidoglycan/LPS O-acetylase OafA/YrhL